MEDSLVRNYWLAIWRCQAGVLLAMLAGLPAYGVIPAPRTATFTGSQVVLDAGWMVDRTTLGASHIAVRWLIADLEAFHQYRPGGAGKAIRLAVEPKAPAQGYRLEVASSGIRITGNSDQGLFYGVQTLLQSIRRDAAGRLVIGEGTIDDAPDLELRFLHWDTKHHQDRMETLKRYLDWAARFKINMIGFELEDKFSYPSHPAIGAPGAFTPAELQEIVNYGLERFIEVVPVVQAPAHMAYVLKHPEFAALKADGNNYMSKLCDPRTYELIFSMYDDLINATKGVRYFFLSTDEVYYAGIESECAKPYNEENRSLAWVEFVRRARDHVAKRGRRPLAWVEYPLLPEHAKMLPADLIDGVVGEDEYLAAEKALGMRQLGYVSLQGAEYLFPNHLPLEGPGGLMRGRLESVQRSIAGGRFRQGNPMGVFGAAWDDSGLHNETFWLGWSAVAQYGWNPRGVTVEAHAAEFMRVYYGPQAVGMIELYRMLQRQARAWESTWQRVTSRVRGPGYGNSYGKGRGTERRDMTLTPPALPGEGDLAFAPAFGARHAGFVETARQRMLESDQLIHGLEENLGRVERNQYNLEVMGALARFIRHHWRLLAALAEAEDSLGKAQVAGQKKDAAAAVGQLVAAFNAVNRESREGEAEFAALTAVFEKSRYPKRVARHVLDDTKDHWADRTPDLGYMAAPERSIGLPKWLAELRRRLEAYAKQNGVPVKGLAEARLEE